MVFLAQPAFAPPKGQRSYLEGCGDIVAGFDPGQVNPDLARPVNKTAIDADRHLALYLQKVPPNRLVGEALGTLLIELKKVAPRSDVVAGALARFNIPPPEGFATWNTEAVASALENEWKRLGVTARAVRLNFSTRADLDVFYQALKGRGASDAMIADCFNTIPVNSDGWTEKSVRQKFAERDTDTAEKMLTEYREFNQPTPAQTGKLVRDLIAHMKGRDSVLSALRRDGLVPPDGSPEWTKELLLRYEHFGKTGQFPDALATAPRPERVAAMRKILDDKDFSAAKLKDVDVDILLAAYAEKFPHSADEKPSVEWLAGLYFHLSASNAYKMDGALHRAGILTLAGGKKWDRAAIDALLDAEALRIQSMLGNPDFSQRKNLDALYQYLRSRGANAIQTAAIFNRMQVNGAKWSDYTIERKFEGKNAAAEATLAKIQALPTKDAKHMAPLVRELLASGKSRQDVVDELAREGIRPPEEIEHWSTVAIERLVQMKDDGVLPTAEQAMNPATPHADRARKLLTEVRHRHGLADGEEHTLPSSDLLPAMRAIISLPLNASAAAIYLNEAKIRPPHFMTGPWTAKMVLELLEKDRVQRRDRIRTNVPNTQAEIQALHDQLRADGLPRSEIVELFNAIPIRGGGWTDLTVLRDFGGGVRKEIEPIKVDRLILKTQEQQDRWMQVRASAAINSKPEYTARDLQRRGIPPPPGKTAWTGSVVEAELNAVVDAVLRKHRGSLAVRETFDAVLRDLDALEFGATMIAKVLTERKVPAPKGSVWHAEIIRNYVNDIRAGNPSATTVAARFPWRATKGWKSETVTTPLKENPELSIEEAVEGYLDLRWHGLTKTRILELFNAESVPKNGKRSQTWGPALERWVEQYQNRVIARIEEEKPSDEAKTAEAIRQLDAICIDPSRTAEILNGFGSKHDGEPWTAAKVAAVLQKRSGDREVKGRDYIYHPDFDRPEKMKDTLASTLALVTEKEAEAHGSTHIWGSMKPMSEAHQAEVVRVYNYWKYRASKGGPEKEEAQKMARRYRNVLWTSNLLLARHIVKSTILPEKHTRDEWESYAAEGLMNGIDAYDYRRPTKLSSVMAEWARAALSAQASYLNSAKRRGGYLATDLAGTDPIAGRDVVEDTADMRKSEVLSPEESETAGVLDSVLRRLEPRTQEVLRLRFGLGGQEPMKLDDIAVHLGVSKMTVSNHITKGLTLLREYLGDDFMPE